MDLDLDFLLDSIGIQQPDEVEDFICPPYRMSSQRYVGLGDQRNQNIEDNDFFTPDVLRIDPTPPTSTISPIRDLLTGEIIKFIDSPISSVSTDDSSINRPLGSNADNYIQGASSGVPFLPGGFAPEKKNANVNIDQYLLSLDTGSDLLSTPFNETITIDNGEVEELPNLPEFNDLDKIKATTSPRSTHQIISDITKTYAIEDKWDVSEFSTKVTNPALTFPYKLDPFQLRAIYRLELNQCVFVSAPTSAGKTVVAQYAIALCRSHKMRALYTSPIKALSNQKFRDLTKQFGDVGLLTGDVSLNREASCIIMTTEILRSMLYKGADILRDVECVIFDECHYISNDERGVVWEESIILMPFHINMVFLSATVPNAKEIADWIGRTKQRTVYVEEHKQRPVPIEHALYTGDSNFYVIGRNGATIQMNRIVDAQLSIQSERGKIDFSSMYWMKFVLSAEQAKLLPILIFCFSQQMCEELATNLLGLELLTKKEKNHVVGFCRKALMRLNKEDRSLPQISTIFSLLEVGVAVHHGGVLPIVKEIVEILLAEGYVKVLFCTSTFAMGINVPARSCAFVSMKKYNGKIITDLTPNEYVQMSGRAGRRGLDTVGTSIIICWGEIPKTEYLRTLMNGKVEALQSQFKLKFNMILNLLRVKDIKMVDILRRSLSANLIQSTMPQLLKELKDLEKKLKALPKIDCPFMTNDIEDVGNYMENGFGNDIYNMRLCTQEMVTYVDDQSLLGQLKRGRVVYVLDEVTPTLAVISQKPQSKEEIHAYAANGKEITFPVDNLGVIFAKPKKSAQNIKQADAKSFLAEYSGLNRNRKVSQNSNDFEQPLEWTKIFSTSDFDFTQYSQEQVKYYQQVVCSPCFNCVQLANHHTLYNEKYNLDSKIQEIRHKIADESLQFKPLLDQHVKCLQVLGYVEQDNVLTLKGRVSIEINTCHEILATELLFAGVFENLNPIELASCVSALVCDRTTNKSISDQIPKSLVDSFSKMKEIAKNLEKTFGDLNISLEEDWVDRNLNVSLSQAVFDWASGKSFKDIMYTTDAPEGKIVWVINRVSEALKDFANAAQIMGCLDLSNNFQIAMEIIKRDIIFASSLYFD
ncbi:hypothetical protein M9Y10_012435 [Tritrichomonas musculus]|uniref:DEAD/DEAH box helicase family protein n=1 Tax=Tritrichomonas musculus TaxID=1915356 RepID=A0ABR2ICI3_9EUKA